MNASYRSFRNIFLFLARVMKLVRSRNSATDRRRNPGSANSQEEISPSNGAADFSTMPAPRVEEALQNAAGKSRQALIDALRSLASATDSRNYQTRGHSERVTRFSVEIAKLMGLPDEEMERIRIGALIHDIGKITIDQQILNKPAALTETEYEVIKTHTTRGYDLLKQFPEVRDVTPGILLHHEQLDGKGYPHGLKGDEIPMMVRVITVADCFDAGTTIRHYQDPAPVEYVVAMIRSAAGIKYDERVVDALVRGVRTGRIITRVEDRLKPEE